MKNLIKFSLFTICTFGVLTSNAQISAKGVVNDLPDNSPAFIDFSRVYYSGSNNESRGMIVPSVNLGTFVFQYDPNSSTDYPTFFDGMVVYNNATSATTVTGGDNPSTSESVVPGFYYFSNPNGESNGNLTSGRWLPLGGQAATVKSKTVEVIVPANPTTATLDLDTDVILANEVVTFLGAKIYNSDGNLVMTADSAYNKATNLLTTGNGIMYQVLPEGTYQVVVDYK